jgi:membrane protein
MIPRLVGRVAERAWTVIRLTGLSFWRGAVSFYESEDLTYASSIAYFTLMSFFPTLLLLLAVLGSATATEADRAAVLEFVLRYFPQQFDFVTTQLDAFRYSRVQLGVAGSLLLIWASLGVFGAITTAVNYAWGVEKQPSFFKHKLVSFLMLIAAGLLMLLALILVSLQGVVEAWWFETIAADAPVVHWIGNVASRWATTLLLVVVVGLVFYYVPNAKVRFRDVWVGAVVTGLLWKGAVEGFRWYVRDMTRLTLIHGSIAAVIVFLFWVYVSAVIFLYGVEFTAAYSRLRRHRPEDAPAAPPIRN